MEHDTITLEQAFAIAEANESQAVAIQTEEAWRFAELMMVADVARGCH